MKLKEFKMTSEDKTLLLDILLDQRYAIELVSSEISDIENGFKKADEKQMRRLSELYDRLSEAGF